MSRRVVLLAALVVATGSVGAQQLPDGRLVPAGDPTLCFAEGRYHLFSSGRGAPIFRSPDLFTWEPAGRVFDKLPEWATEAVPESRGYIWAPDIVKIGDEYRAYWSTSTPGSRRSVIGFASNRTLDPASRDYRWVDRGKVIETFLTNDWNAIDPQCFVDQEGKVWLAMGSYWTGIKLHRLDPKTGHLSAEDATLYSLARRTDVDPPALEGAYILWRDGYYYLFVSFDRCHLGVDSNYNMRVGRSRAVTGPYADRADRALMDSGGTLIFESQGHVRGPGHNSVLQHGGKTWTAFHYFNDPQRKGSRVLQIREITWDNQGWPVIGETVRAPAARPGQTAEQASQFQWQNPVINGPAWIRDAYILRMGDRYYLTGTTRVPNIQDGAARWPGFYLWSSDDLQHWREEGCLVSNQQVKWADRNFWAPEIRWHPTRKKFYLCFNARQSVPDETLRMGMGLAVADRVTGPYTLLTPDAPITDNNDASLFFDDDGKDYVAQTGFNLAQIDLDTARLVGRKRKVFAGGGPGEWDDSSAINEGSTLLKINGTYYYFWSCNAWGYFVGYATATNLFGPYTRNPRNPIWGAAQPKWRNVANQPADLPFTEVGHGTPFLGPDGRLWVSGHGHVIEAGARHPYNSPRLCMDPMNFNPRTGEFTSALSWKPQFISVDPQNPAVERARGGPLGSVLVHFGQP